MEKYTASNHFVEDAIETAVNKVKHTTEVQIQRASVFTRRSPVNALLYAILAGYVLRSVPVVSITAALLRLAFSLVRPFVFLLGAAKAYELVSDCCDKDKDSSTH